MFGQKNAKIKLFELKSKIKFAHQKKIETTYFAQIKKLKGRPFKKRKNIYFLFEMVQLCRDSIYNMDGLDLGFNATLPGP